MATRSCAYKDCEYYYALRGNTQPRSMFAFPKQAERARIWHENGQVHPKIPQTQLFMCASHFDRKFISSSKNRTLLVGEAVPFPYGKTDPDPEEEPEQVASTSQESYLINLSDDEVSINSVDTTSRTNPPETEPHRDLKAPSTKRSRESTLTIHPSEKEAPKADPSPTEAHVSVEPSIIDTSEVSVFTFKGQEYVQMSMDYYLKEKQMMAELLNNYRNALRSIKGHVSQLDL
ncbi:uncharacterized protein LOC108032918 [Drosophila biarmipes]|uniref:uncharacterized protein LOC108032918 n=1 Tax=Drosophila biarmipes TaxID=125945 RepID=UPI0007E8AD56|nr:uncharacterized protein LOC108032918 [Drosophila biarmipes]